MKFISTIVSVIISISGFAQTGIGTTTPNASAKLDVYSTNKGFLPPRIALLSINDVATIASPATGLVIFNTATAGTTPNNVLPGYYYWDGSKWNGLVDQSSLNAFSGFVPNYAQSNALVVTTGTAGAIIVSQSITTSGRPIQIIATGDANPPNAAWCQLQLYRDGVAIGKKLQAESSNGNENVPYCLNFIDNPTAGTYTYSVRFVTGSGSFQFGEADGNNITLLELGAWSAGTMPVSKGGTGNSSYTAGSVLFSDGTNITQNNSGLFWDNTNGRFGIGTNNPTARLNVAGGGVRLATGFGNSTSRPSLSTSSIGSYEIRGVGSITGNTQNDLADDGFLRLTAGGGSSVSSQSSIDISGFSTIPDMSNNIVMRTNGTERLRIDNGGNVNVTGKLNVTDPTGNVSTKVTGRVTAGTFLSFENLRFSVTTSEPRGLSIATGSGSVNLYVEGRYNNGASTIYGARTAGVVTYSTTASGSAFGWGFNSSGDTIIYHLTDPDNGRLYRVTLIIMPSYINNFICVERLL
jgi:hypothetical protein